MPVDIVMPRLSDTMEEGTVARWLKKPGDAVKRGETIAQIETDKALMDYEAFEDGTLGEIKVKDGESAPLGAAIAVLFRPGEQPVESAEASADAPAAQPPPRSEPSPAATDEKPPSQPKAKREAATGPGAEDDADRGAGRFRASPLARRIAAEHGVDLGRVTGSGPGGRIVRADVEEVLASLAAPAGVRAQAGDQLAPERAEVVPFTRMQSVVARRMVESKAEAPHIYLTVPIDMAAALRFRADSLAYLGKDAGFSLNDLFVKAAALTLRKIPIVNAGYNADPPGIRYHDQINVGFAVALENGLVVPVIRDADRKSLPEIGAEARTLAEKARSGGLAVPDYEGGTFTISNLGMLGIESFVAVVNPPQSAILAIGAVTAEPVVVDGQVQVGQRCRVTLSCDHRVVYGWTAGEFLRELRTILEHPFGLVYQTPVMPDG